MSRTLFLSPALLAACTALAVAQDPAPAEPAAPPKDTTLLQALPSGAIAFAETSGLAELIAAIRNSKAVKTIFGSEQFKEFQSTEQFEKVNNGRQLAEFVLRMDLWEAGRKLLGGRAGLALYPKEDSEKPDLVFLLRPADPRAWASQRIWTDPLLGLSAKRIDPQRFNLGLKVYQTKGKDDAPAFVALNKHWIALATDAKLLEKTITLQIGDPQERTRLKLDQKVTPLARDAVYRKMARRTGADHLARLLVDTRTIAKATGGRLGLPEKLDNPLASLVGGGVVELAARSTMGTLTINTDESGLVLEAGFDGNPKKLPERYQVFFSDHPKTGTTALPEVPGLIGGFTVYRDLATWYRSRDELLEESVLPEFDKFEAGVGNLLPGKDMGEDVLPLLGNNVTFVSALQDYAHVDGEPGVKLPAFAFVIELEEADQATDIFQLFFQTLLSVLNIEAGQKGRQPWLIETKTHHEVTITTARYLEKPKGKQLPIVFNFLPASARVGNKYIVSSSLGLCEDLIDAMQKPAADQRLDRNLHFEVRFQPLAEVLAANADHFEAKRVSEGRTAKQARADVELFLTLLRQLDSFSATTSADDDGFKLHVKGKLRSAN